MLEDWDHDWRYLRGREVLHALRTGSSKSRCGQGPGLFRRQEWLGTGSQQEYETAAALPRCIRCVSILTWPKPEREAIPRPQQRIQIRWLDAEGNEL